MKKVILVVPLILGLYACGDAAEENTPEKETVAQQTEASKMKMEVRIDKYLWCIRVFKSRSDATDACKGGKVKVNSADIKPCICSPATRTT